MTGSVGSWKTEEIGFEVAGRVLQVLEPSAEIEGRILDQSGQTVLAEGTALARLDDERYRIAARAAQSAVDVATRRMEAIRIDIEHGIRARMVAAETEQTLAKAELDRARTLVTRKAISQSEFDQTRTTYETATANIAILNAELDAKRAELRSVEAQVDQAKLHLAEAERDLRDATLYSSFRGQVAQVHVVPGSYVAAGQPVLTIQMMDPIQVELELSAAMSRKFRYGDRVRLLARGADGQSIPLAGFVYMTDAVADTDTRTFTVTLLVRNQKVQPTVDSGSDGQPLARTRDIWPLNVEPIIGGGVALMVEANAIRHDSAGAFVWRVTNRHIGDVSSDASRVLNVSKVRVTQGDLVIPFLGNWNFVPITINDGETFDPNLHLVAGEIIVEDGDADSWNGDRILLDRSDWLLRPGDTVRVDLPSGEAESGYYVPVKAIRHESDRASVFVVDQSPAGQSIARRIDVNWADIAYPSGGDDLLRRIEPIGDTSFADGISMIVEGVHYLVDGEAVAVVDPAEDDR
jgi:multidrug resistance efflux pump